MADRGAELRARLAAIAKAHEERMATDPTYRYMFLVLQHVTKPAERVKHYDRDGYCDNPARGY